MDIAANVTKLLTRPSAFAMNPEELNKERNDRMRHQNAIQLASEILVAIVANSANR